MKSFSTKVASALTIVMPSVAAAQIAGVTTAPIAQPVPAMSTLMLLGLSVILALLAARLLRRAPKGALAALALALVTTAAGVAHSHPNDIVVEGGECSTEFTHEYNPLAGPFLLVSACANPIRIVALGVDCFPPGETLGDVTSNAAIPCEEGLVLPPNGQCELPSCPS